MAGPEDDVTQAEKRRIIREQASTMFQHARSRANDEAGGRSAAVNAATVVGSEPAVKYPAASTSWQIQLPDEPPLGFDNPALDDPTGGSLVSAPVATGGAAAAPSVPPDVEHAAPPPSSKGSSDDGAPA
jgi:hypothetical protein